MAKEMLRGVIAAGLVAASLVPGRAVVGGGLGGGEGASPSRPWVEVRAPGSFEPDAVDARGETTVTYRVDATVLLPLLIASVPVASRTDVGVGENPTRAHQAQPYVHNGRVYRFELRDVDGDRGRAVQYARDGWVGDPARVRRLKYTIRDEQWHEVETFELWVELVTSEAEGVSAAPIIPIAFEFKPRAFLALKAVRTS